MLSKEGKDSVRIKSGKNIKTEIKIIFQYLFISLVLLFIGFDWWKEIETKGYYIDRKYGTIINGHDGIITIYVFIISGFILLIYTFYLIFKNLQK